MDVPFMPGLASSLAQKLAQKKLSNESEPPPAHTIHYAFHVLGVLLVAAHMSQ